MLGEREGPDCVRRKNGIGSGQSVSRIFRVLASALTFRMHVHAQLTDSHIFRDLTDLADELFIQQVVLAHSHTNFLSVWKMQWPDNPVYLLQKQMQLLDLL